MIFKIRLSIEFFKVLNVTKEPSITPCQTRTTTAKNSANMRTERYLQGCSVSLNAKTLKSFSIILINSVLLHANKMAPQLTILMLRTQMKYVEMPPARSVQLPSTTMTLQKKSVNTRMRRALIIQTSVTSIIVMKCSLIILLAHFNLSFKSACNAKIIAVYNSNKQ